MTGPSAAVARLRALADTGGLDELCGAIALYESEPAAFANAQMAAIAERVETDPMRRLNLDLMAG